MSTIRTCVDIWNTNKNKNTRDQRENRLRSSSQVKVTSQNY